MYRVIDLFCGIGGFSYGFEMTKKFKTILGVDMWDVALKTFKQNHSGTLVLQKRTDELNEDFWIQYAGETDVIIAGPPCQGFSMSGKRDVLDDRNNLFKEVIRIAYIVKPKVIVIENVVGLLSMTDENGKQIKEKIINDLDMLGYNVKFKVLNAVDFGVPQARKRVIFIATKNRKIEFPKEKFNKKNYITVWDAISNITEDGFYSEPINDFQKLMRGRNDILNHDPIKHSNLIVERMSYVPPGGNWKNIPIELGQGGGVHSNNYRRLDPSKPSITIKHVSKSMIIHPIYNRTPTIREVARLQSFDDNFEFIGTKYDQHQQLANAVPPLLGKAIAESILKILEG